METIMHNTTLTKINLSENCIDNDFADNLSTFLISNFHFQHLNLSTNRLTDNFAIKLIQSSYQYPACTISRSILAKKSNFPIHDLETECMTMTRNSRLQGRKLISEYKHSIEELRKDSTACAELPATNFGA